MKMMLLMWIMLVGISTNVSADGLGSYKKVCEGGDTAACAILGVMYYSGEGIKQDYSEAKGYFSKACDGVMPMDARALHYSAEDNEALF